MRNFEGRAGNLENSLFIPFTQFLLVASLSFIFASIFLLRSLQLCFGLGQKPGRRQEGEQGRSEMLLSLVQVAHEHRQGRI